MTAMLERGMDMAAATEGQIYPVWARPEFADFAPHEIGALRQAGMVIAAYGNRPGWVEPGHRPLEAARAALRSATARGVTSEQLASALNHPVELIDSLLRD